MLVNQLITLILPLSIYAIDRIEIKGSKFFNAETGEQFFMKGVAYQPRNGGNSDPLAYPNNCKRDVKYLKELGVNTIRVYESYPWNNHDECMKTFEDAGIYLLLDLAIPEKSVNRLLPHYDTDIFVHHKQNVDAFYKYKNVIGFFAGNEVTNDEKTTPASAHIKAILRDVKSYLKNKGSKIPVGYANNDDPKVRKHIQDYFNCGDDDSKADFYGINIYSWCGDSTFKTSGYDKRTEEVKDYSIPSILSEFGCNTQKPRKLGDIDALFDEMASTWSGGIVYEYTEEQNEYGLVKIKSGKVEKLNDFDLVKEKYNKAKPKSVSIGDYNSKNKKSNCPKVNDEWKASEKLPPTPNEEACECIFNTLSCQVNDKGDSSENGEAVGKLIGQICGKTKCDSTNSNEAKGVYGDFSTCSTKVRNSIIFNQAVKDGAKCDFNGFASENKKASGKDDKECKKLSANLKSAPTPDKSKSKSKSNSAKDSDPSDDESSDEKSDSKSKGGNGGNSSAAILNYSPFLAIGFVLAFMN